jgi:hypothetical protein
MYCVLHCCHVAVQEALALLQERITATRHDGGTKTQNLIMYRVLHCARVAVRRLA